MMTLMGNLSLCHYKPAHAQAGKCYVWLEASRCLIVDVERTILQTLGKNQMVVITSCKRILKNVESVDDEGLYNNVFHTSASPNYLLIRHYVLLFLFCIKSQLNDPSPVQIQEQLEYETETQLQMSLMASQVPHTTS